MIMNALKIFTQNIVDENSEITVSSGDATKGYLYDQKPATQWSSVGSNDTVAETIDVRFLNWQQSEIPWTIDRVILLNHNFKSITIDAFIDYQWVRIYTNTALAVENSVIVTDSQVQTNWIRITVLSTQIANQNKYLGELKLCSAILDGTQLWRSEISRSDEQLSGTERTAGGRLVFWREWTKYSGSGTLYDVALADHDKLFPYLKAAQLVTIVFYEDFDPTECYECAIVSPPRHTINRKTGLFEISLELQER